MLICEFNYCIYNKQNECILKNINISSLGYCDDCIIPDINEKLLNDLKKDTLTQMDKRIKD